MTLINAMNVFFKTEEDKEKQQCLSFINYFFDSIKVNFYDDNKKLMINFCFSFSIKILGKVKQLSNH